MKGTYDNRVGFWLEFDCSEYAKKYKEETGGQWTPEKRGLPYKDCDGLSTISAMEELNADSFSVLVTDPVILEAYRLDKNKGNYRTLLPRVDKPQEEESIEYTIAKAIKDNYATMSDYQRKMSLAFLERYVLDYEEVREIQKSGVIDLSSVDKKFGSSGKTK